MSRRPATRPPAQTEPANLYRHHMRLLTPRHRAFVRAVLDGGTLEESAQLAGYKRGPRIVPYLLGLAPVAAALQQLAPLSGSDVAREVARRFAERALVDGLNAPNAPTRISAAREVLSPVASAAAAAARSGVGTGSPVPGAARDYERRRAQVAERRAAAAGSPEPSAAAGAGVAGGGPGSGDVH